VKGVKGGRHQTPPNRHTIASHDEQPEFSHPTERLAESRQLIAKNPRPTAITNRQPMTCPFWSHRENRAFHSTKARRTVFLTQILLVHASLPTSLGDGGTGATGAMVAKAVANLLPV